MFRVLQRLKPTRSQLRVGSQHCGSIIVRSLATKRVPGKVVFVCSDCGAESAKWTGQCSACKAWSTIREFRPGPELAAPGGMAARLGGQAASEAGGYRSWNTSGSALTPGGGGAGGSSALVSLSDFAEDLKRSSSASWPSKSGMPSRIRTGAPEVDRVLGGGLVHGSVILLAGSPGIGKSTLVLQLAQSIAGASDSSGAVVYIAGEESPLQIAQRAMRLAEGQKAARDAADTDTPPTGAIVGAASSQVPGSAASPTASSLDNIRVLHETSLDEALETILAHSTPTPANESASKAASRRLDLPFSAIIVDSIQTMYLSGVASAAGTVTQVRECALRLLQLAKATGVPVILIGHMTKGGEVAGPRVLEHLVDAVLLLEGEGAGSAPVRALRGAKNRFGATSEVALLRMTDAGLEEVSDAAGMFLSPGRAEILRNSDLALKGPDGTAAAVELPSGSAVTAALEGRRAVCIEIEALCSASPSEWPRHRAAGLPVDRLHMLLAVLAKHAGVRATRSDVYLSVAGGIRLRDPAAEAAVAAALASSVLELALPADTAILGEVALSGELRAVTGLDERLAALGQLGFRRAIVPAEAAPGASSKGAGAKKHTRKRRFLKGSGGWRIEVIPVRSIRQALNEAMGFQQLKAARAVLRQKRRRRTASPLGREEEEYAEEEEGLNMGDGSPWPGVGGGGRDTTGVDWGEDDASAEATGEERA